MENNSIVLSGEITKELEYSHNIYGEDYYVAPLKIKRYSGTYDIINLLISDRILFQDEKLLNKYVCVSGSIRTKNDKNDRKLRINALVDDIDVFDDGCIDIDENDVEIDGFICKINHVRDTPKGRTVCDVIIAVNRPYGRNDYIPCIFWGKNATYISCCDVGTEIKISGRLQSRSYYKEDKELITYEVSVQNFEIVNEE